MKAFNFMALRPVYDAVWPSCPSGAFLWIDLHLSLHPLARFLLLKFTRESFFFWPAPHTWSFGSFIPWTQLADTVQIRLQGKTCHPSSALTGSSWVRGAVLPLWALWCHIDVTVWLSCSPNSSGCSTKNGNIYLFVHNSMTNVYHSSWYLEKH